MRNDIYNKQIALSMMLKEKNREVRRVLDQLARKRDEMHHALEQLETEEQAVIER